MTQVLVVVGVFLEFLKEFIFEDFLFEQDGAVENVSTLGERDFELNSLEKSLGIVHSGPILEDSAQLFDLWPKSLEALFSEQAAELSKQLVGSVGLPPVLRVLAKPEWLSEARPIVGLLGRSEIPRREKSSCNLGITNPNQLPSHQLEHSTLAVLRELRVESAKRS